MKGLTVRGFPYVISNYAYFQKKILRNTIRAVPAVVFQGFRVQIQGKRQSGESSSGEQWKRVILISQVERPGNFLGSLTSSAIFAFSPYPYSPQAR